MFPTIAIAEIEISVYYLLIMIGLAVCLWLAFKIGKRCEIAFKNIIFATVGVMIGAFLGGHLFFAATNTARLSALVSGMVGMSFGEIAAALGKIFDGVLFYGGFLGGLTALSIYCVGFKKEKRNVLSDVFAFSLPLLHFFGKIGCFMRGCCNGKALAIGPLEISAFPVSLLEAYFNLLLFFLLFHVFKKGKFSGRLVWLYMLFYPVTRFFTEYLRGDNAGRIWFGFSASQWISVVLFAVAFLYFVITAKQTVKEALSQPALLEQNKSFIKLVLLGLLTFGIYNMIIKARVVKDINTTTQHSEKKRTISYWLMFFVLGPLTLGIWWIVWYHRLSAKVGRELERRNINMLFSAGDYWLWKMLGIIVLVGPFVYSYRLLMATNLINTNYNNRKDT